MSEFRKRHVCLMLQGSDRCTVTASPQNTAHPQVGLINLARHCWSNKPEVAVWLSLFSAERSVSTKHCQSWLQPQEAASNPAQEFNPCRQSWVSTPQQDFSCCLEISWDSFELHNLSDHKNCRSFIAAPQNKRNLITLQKAVPQLTAVKYAWKQVWKGDKKWKENLTLYNWFRLFCCQIAVGRLLSWRLNHVYSIVLFLSSWLRPQFMW